MAGPGLPLSSFSSLHSLFPSDELSDEQCCSGNSEFCLPEGSQTRAEDVTGKI